MIEERARVLEVSAGRARVSAQRQSTCGHCSANASCGTSVLSRYVGQRSMEMWVEDPLGVAAGDEVLLQLREGGLLTGSVLLYLMPLLVFIASALLGEQLALRLAGGAEWVTILCAGLGLGVAYRWLRGQGRRLDHDNRFRPVIIKRLNGFTIQPFVAPKPL